MVQTQFLEEKLCNSSESARKRLILWQVAHVSDCAYLRWNCSTWNNWNWQAGGGPVRLRNFGLAVSGRIGVELALKCSTWNNNVTTHILRQNCLYWCFLPSSSLLRRIIARLLPL